MRSLFGGKRVHRCTRCGHAFCSEHLPVAMIANYYESFWNDRSSTGLAQRGAVLRHNVRSSLIWARDRLSGERGVRASEHLEFPPLASWLAGAHARNLRMLEIGAGPAEFSRAMKRIHRPLRADVVEPAEDFGLLYRLSGISRVSRTWEPFPRRRNTT